jgi:hypothetical protein
MTDPISRRDAKGEPSDDDMLRRGDVKATLFPLWDRVTGEPVCELAAAIDKLPALDADGRLIESVRAVDDGWHYELTKEEAEFIENMPLHPLPDYEGVPVAPPAAERRPAVERPDRPTMLLARRFTGMGGIWVWLTRKEADWACQWHGSDDCDYKSRDLLEVDRNASDSAALALYDADISTSARGVRGR